MSASTPLATPMLRQQRGLGQRGEALGRGGREIGTDLPQGSPVPSILFAICKCDVTSILFIDVVEIRVKLGRAQHNGTTFELAKTETILFPSNRRRWKGTGIKVGSHRVPFSSLTPASILSSRRTRRNAPPKHGRPFNRWSLDTELPQEAIISSTLMCGSRHGESSVA